MDSQLLFSRLKGFPTTIEPLSKTSITVGLVFGYLALVRLLRFRAVRNLEKKYAHLLGNPYSMTYKEAQQISKLSSLHDMPYMTRMSGIYALIKTYGIASGTPLLIKTRQLSTSERVSKRIEDTGLAFTEVIMGDMDGERSMRALAKVNWLHARYKNVISNEEMLHTLSITGFEGMRFIDLYEWRKLTDLERVALYVLWREIGLRMGVRDIPPNLEVFQEWTLNFEKDNMYYTDTNKVLADTALGLILRDAPKWQHGFLKNVSSVFMEEKSLRAIGWDDPPRWVTIFVLSFLRIRAFAIKNFFLPRFRDVDLLPKLDHDGRIYKVSCDLDPWYMKDTFWTRWSVWLGSKGKRVPGTKYKSNGYLPEELGPLELEKASKQPVIKQADAMSAYVHGGGEKLAGCPFMFGDVGNWK
jgi:hypothetical protein